MKYVIIGNGIAGVTAAQNIRSLDPSGEITILSDEQYPFYSRIRLIEYLSGIMDDRDLILKDEGWYADQKITLMNDIAVTDIDTSHKEAITTDNLTVPYDRLLLATGGISFIPPIPGTDKKGVFALRTLNDAKAINNHIKGGNKRVILIGGGVLGLEAGYNLTKARCMVTVIEFFPRLLPRQMDQTGASILQGQMEKMGFTFHLGVKTEKITGEEYADGIVLDDGAHIEGNTVLVSAGVRPRVELAKELGLTIEKGVAVNDRMETGVSDIYAAGDLIEHRGAFYGIWPASEKQGEIAGINMAGGAATYSGTVASNVLKVAGVDLATAGDIDAEGNHESIVKEDKESFVYKKLVIENNTIIGTILYGDIQDFRKIIKAIEDKRDIRGIRDALMDWKLDRL